MLPPVANLAARDSVHMKISDKPFSSGFPEGRDYPLDFICQKIVSKNA